MSTIQMQSSGGERGRAFKPGPGVVLLAAVLALVAVAAVVLVLSSGGSAAPRVSAQDSTFGSLPSWLPKSARTAARDAAPKLEVATASHPILSEEQGYTVHAQLPSGSVEITAAGPGFPHFVSNAINRGDWPDAKPVPSTFYVTLTHVSGTIPLAASAFSVENANYQHRGVTLSLSGGGAVPTSVRAGQTLTLEVHTKTIEGQGAIAWSPLTGGRTLVAWIYQVELD